MTNTTQTWIEAHPDIRMVRAAAADLNGVARGKSLPRATASKLDSAGTRFPLSVMNLDIWGHDIENSPLVFESGDQDGFLFPTERGPMPMPWLETPTALAPIWMFNEDGSPFAGDPRHALNAVVQRFAAKGLTPVVAVELEFYLVDDSGTTIAVPLSPNSGKRRDAGDILSIAQLDAFDAFFTELYAACDAMDIPADTVISESGHGQFEVNLNHVADPLKAADDAWLFKMLIRGLARRHGFGATFMAKPYLDHSGSGMHAHFSVVDASGTNIFDDGSDAGTSALRHAIAGCLAAMSDSTLIFAPHANSYARHVPGSHAPSTLCWAYENRTVAIRVPSGPSAARRIEHRLPGGDVNPYLAIAAILGAALTGIEDAQDPPAPITGNAYDQNFQRIPDTWEGAIAAFENSAIIPRIFDPLLISNLVLTKRQELQEMENRTHHEQTDIYLETV